MIHDTRYGTEPQLELKRNYSNDWNRKAYMRFDLNDLVGYDQADVVDAKLMLNFVTGFGSNPNQDWEFEVYGLNDGDAGEAWGETTINWSNAPANDTGSRFGMLGNTTSLGTFNLTGTGVGLVEFSSAGLLSFIQSSTLDDLATIMVVRNTAGTSNATYVHVISSKENGSVDGPQLLLTLPAAVVPEPSAFALAALDLLGLVCCARRRRP